jgi:hypothetical protein
VRPEGCAKGRDPTSAFFPLKWFAPFASLQPPPFSLHHLPSTGCQFFQQHHSRVSSIKMGILATSFQPTFQPTAFFIAQPQAPTMGLKRKRSDSEISSSSSLLSSPTSANMMSIDNYQPILTPSLFSSRTRKRHRDNRPSESDVHRMQCPFLSAQSPMLIPSTEHTLSLLYSAQQTPQSLFQAPSPFQPQQPVESLPSSNQSTQRSTLHSFWAIPSSRRQTSPSSDSSSSTNTPSTTPAMNNFFQVTNCEDCNASLNPADNGDAMDVDMMMDIDMDGENHACTSCGKQVCHSCSVRNLGADKRCLHCAGRKTRVGGIGRCDRD